MTLYQFLRTNHVTYQAFATQLGVCKSQVWRWANEQRTPTLKTALEIQRLTDGAVKPEDWQQ
jgi:DNA-binding transcriptional regulator YdaS (Cro superfamily)